VRDTMLPGRLREARRSRTVCPIAEEKRLKWLPSTRGLSMSPLVEQDWLTGIA
jgi:hypothetical protein